MLENQESKAQLILLEQMDSKTGLTHDYINEFSAVASIKGFIEAGIKPSDNFFNPLRKYRERYSEDVYKNLVTEHNLEAIDKLDAIVEQINILLKKRDTTPAALTAYSNFVIEVKLILIGS